MALMVSTRAASDTTAEEAQEFELRLSAHWRRAPEARVALWPVGRARHGQRAPEEVLEQRRAQRARVVHALSLARRVAHRGGGLVVVGDAVGHERELHGAHDRRHLGLACQRVERLQVAAEPAAQREWRGGLGWRCEAEGGQLALGTRHRPLQRATRLADGAEQCFRVGRLGRAGGRVGHPQQRRVGGREGRRLVELLGGGGERLLLHRQQRALRLGARQPGAAQQRIHPLHHEAAAAERGRRGGRRHPVRLVGLCRAHQHGLAVECGEELLVQGRGAVALRREEQRPQREQPPVRVAEPLGRDPTQRARQVEQRRAALGV
eukprot:scaffold16424_cov61-Phaeocystis_antarctica.AAC.8